MTYRGVYWDGVVVLPEGVDLRNGDRVEVSAARRRGIKSKAKAKAKVAVARTKGAATSAKSRVSLKAPSAKAKAAQRPLPGFGAWKHRTDIVDSVEFARGLRKRTSTRRLAD